MTQPPDKSKRPSLYKAPNTVTPASFSVLDAATVQGSPRRRKESAERPAAEKTASARRPFRARWWLLGGAVVVIGSITFAMNQGETPAVVTVAKPTPTSPPAAAVASKPAVIEAPVDNAADDTDPLKILEADNSRPAAAAKPAAKIPAASSHKDKPRAVALAHAKPASNHPPAAKEPAKPAATRDGDVDLMEAMLSRIGKPPPKEPPKSN